MNSPLVSTIIPTYNRYELVCSAIDSVLDQTYDNIEIIVVDDGSSDETASLQKRYKEKIRYFHQPNAGLSSARNLAMQAARGNYVSLLDDDDLWTPHKTEIQVACLENLPRCAFVFSDFEIFNDNGTVAALGLSTWFDSEPDWRDIFSKLITIGLESANNAPLKPFVGNLYHHLLAYPYVLPSTAIFRRSAVATRHPFPENNTHCGDWAFFAELSRHYPCAFIPEPLARNRSHDDPVRLTRKMESTKLYDRYDMIQRVWGVDEDFKMQHASVLRTQQLKTRIAIIRALLKEGQTKKARLEIKNVRKEGQDVPLLEMQLYFFLSFFPFWMNLKRRIQRSLPQFNNRKS